MKIAVIDGQGGGIGKTLVEKLVKEIDSSVQIIALGTNAAATGVMLKAGASQGASGENAIIYNSSKVDIIVGPIGIIAANSMMGELTPEMARAIAESPAFKVIIPVRRCSMEVAGVSDKTLPDLIDDAIDIVKKYIEEKKD